MATITDSYANHVLHFPEKTAIHTQQHSVSYRDWDVNIRKTANWLDLLQSDSKTIGIYLPNGIPFLQLFTGAALAGWIGVLFDTKWKEAELQKRLSVSRPSVLITNRKLAGNIMHLYPQLLVWEDCFEEIRNTDSARNLLIDGNLPFYMGFTSGTTGDPKAFIRSHESWVASFTVNKLDFLMAEHEHVLIPGALIHSHFLYGAISTLFLGGTVYLLEKFSPLQALSIIKNKPITTVFVVPTMVQAFLKQNQIFIKPINMISSGAKWEENSKQLIRTMFLQLTMFEFYGASELSFVTFLTDNEHNLKPESVGKPCHGVEIQIRQQNQSIAPPYEIGKIYVRSKMNFSGYLSGENSIVTPTGHEEQWITVDDMGYVDEEGFLYIAGREKNMILYGGINIFPEEIEKVISTHPDVEEVAVIGCNDPYWGQIVAAVVKGNAFKKELVRLCKNNLSAYKIPRKWYFVPEMPYTTSGKIARAKLMESLESKVMNH